MDKSPAYEAFPGQTQQYGFVNNTIPAHIYPKQGDPFAQVTDPYQNAQYGVQSSTVLVNQPAVYPVIQMFRETPVRITCQLCRREGVTTTTYVNGALVWIAFFVLLLTLPLGCCFIPFCVKGTKDVIHWCPQCGREVGRWNRM